MLNNSEGFDYIVKCKEIDVEISDSLEKRISKKEIRNLCIFFGILIVFSAIKMYQVNKKIVLPLVLFFVILAIILKTVALKQKWKLTIKNQKIHVGFGMSHYNIEYSELINFEISKKEKKVSRYRRALIDVIDITYMKKGKIKRIFLEIQENIKPEISEICKNFIKKSQLDVNPDAYYDYFDIGGEDDNIKMKAIKKYNNKNLIILGSIFIIILITLALCFYNLLRYII